MAAPYSAEDTYMYLYIVNLLNFHASFEMVYIRAS